MEILGLMPGHSPVGDSGFPGKSKEKCQQYELSAHALLNRLIEESGYG